MPTAEADQHQPPAHRQHQPEHAAARRAERHAYAELVGAARDVERQHAVDAGGGERQAERRERR